MKIRGWGANLHRCIPKDVRLSLSSTSRNINITIETVSLHFTELSKDPFDIGTNRLCVEMKKEEAVDLLARLQNMIHGRKQP